VKSLDFIRNRRSFLRIASDISLRNCIVYPQVSDVVNLLPGDRQTMKEIPMIHGEFRVYSDPYSTVLSSAWAFYAIDHPCLPLWIRLVCSEFAP
jgi:hypothetical protein